MNLSELSILMGGLLTLLMIIFHVRFYTLFGWKRDFEKIRELNQKIFYTIHLALILFFVLIAFISILFMGELSRCTGLACGINVGLGLFWLWRTLWQIFYFRPPKNASSKKTEKMHYALIFIFGMLSVFYFIPVLIKVFG